MKRTKAKNKNVFMFSCGSNEMYGDNCAYNLHEEIPVSSDTLMWKLDF